jgi:hypothetical protein
MGPGFSCQSDRRPLAVSAWRLGPRLALGPRRLSACGTDWEHLLNCPAEREVRVGGAEFDLRVRGARRATDPGDESPHGHRGPFRPNTREAVTFGRDGGRADLWISASGAVPELAGVFLSVPGSGWWVVNPEHDAGRPSLRVGGSESTLILRVLPGGAAPLPSGRGLVRVNVPAPEPRPAAVEWANAPLMRWPADVINSLDDPLGLLRSPQRVIDATRRLRPDDPDTLVILAAGTVGVRRGERHSFPSEKVIGKWIGRSDQYVRGRIESYGKHYLFPEEEATGWGRNDILQAVVDYAVLHPDDYDILLPYGDGPRADE